MQTYVAPRSNSAGPCLELFRGNQTYCRMMQAKTYKAEFSARRPEKKTPTYSLDRTEMSIEKLVSGVVSCGPWP